MEHTNGARFEYESEIKAAPGSYATFSHPVCKPCALL